ncbi:hypothetical protein BDR04DRAFT_1075782 [Suillus decipiens]|nr:hypothetical protein BDR04DRAFT_1075782 [Suillus decipiens]
MPATRNARKKNKIKPFSSQDARKRPDKRVDLRVQPGEKNVLDEQVAMFADDDPYELSMLADAQTPISPVPVAQLPLISEALPLTPLISSSPTMPPTAKPLKGRRRFSADIHELHTTYPSDLDRGTWSAQGFRAGDDDGSIEFDLIESRDRTRIVIHLLCSDTSEYPNTHSFFCHSPEPGSYGEQVKEICDEVLNDGPNTIHDVAKHFLTSISGDDDSEDDQNYDMTADEDMNAFTRPEIHRSVLRRDFEGAHAAGYIPGAIWSGSSELFLTISVPVVELTDKIPAHVLMSWDNQFLLPRQHLVLVISGFWGVYPPVKSDGTLSSAAVHSSTSLKFYVGLSRQYKPSKEHVIASLRRYGLQSDQQNGVEDCMVEEEEDADKESETGLAEDDGTFDKFSLSSSLESLLDEHFLQLLQVRRQFKLGWAAAEELLWRSQELQRSPEILVKEMQEELREAEEEEQRLGSSRYLPHDPLQIQDGHINLLETAFAYLLRRFTLCNRYCVVCHKKLNTVFEALKPYVCTSGLCAYQYYSLNFGPSLEYDICKNTEMVDLLVSLAYVSAAEQVLDEPLPRGLLLKVPDPVHYNSMRDFDSLSVHEMRIAIVQLIDTLPPIQDMKKHLEKKVASGTNKPKLKDMDPSILPAAWSILRWCVASCTAHLQELSEEEDQVQNIGSQWRQFRFMVGAPDKEAKFKYALDQEIHVDPNAKIYPTLYAFHGSPLKNWHSIIRHGLWYKTVAHGRAYGDGVYFAKDGTVSMGSYATASSQCWKNSAIAPSACVALAEIINLPQKFTSRDPYYVVKQTEWIMCRYLLINTTDNLYSNSIVNTHIPNKPKVQNVPFIKHDPNHRPLLSNAKVEIPQPSYKLEKLLGLCQDAYVPPYLDEDDSAVFNAPDEEEVKQKRLAPHVNGKPDRDWEHDANWVQKNIDLLLPPPVDSTPGATMALQKEFRAMMKEQGGAESLATLGWYMPPEFNENLFQWVVEMHSFDPDLPIAKDLESKGVNSLVFEIRFPPTFPHSPPFFRLVMPRFLPFMQGGGGHITIGGSICMDLLTSAGWLPSYNIASVLLQIKLAISSTDPKPARLAQNWEQPYHPQEALSGYTRAAAIHGWKVANAKEMERLVTWG